MKFFCLGLLFSCFSHLAAAEEECPALLNEPDKVKALGQIRVRAIKGWDKLLTWALSPKNRPYQYANPFEQKKYQIDNEELKTFDENYGYFSIYHPIVGITSKSERDIRVTSCLLESLQTGLNKPEPLSFASGEILTKVIAYRFLEKGMKIPFQDTVYVVDAEIDLWRGMPAYGLVPETKGSRPILLFRGTDLNLVSEKGWASLLSDLDTTGPGHSTFLRAKAEIHQWLNKVNEEYGPSRAMGFSLGGVFVFYTLIYEHDLISKEEASVAFNPPGVSKEILEKWQKIPEDQRPPQITYVNQGDFVSQIGFFLDNVWEISQNRPMQVIEAHVSLLSAQPLFRMTRINVESENKNRE